MRSCAPIAIEDCKEANGINYCYCKKEGCNTPERKLSDPHKPGLGHSQAAARVSPDQSFGRYFDDDEDLSEDLIPQEEIRNFLDNSEDMTARRKQLRENLKKRFDQLCVTGALNERK